MKTLQHIFAEVNRADIAFGKIVESVACELSFGETALHIVAIWGDADAIEVLVSNGAEIDKRGEDGFTPLHCAAVHDKPEAVDVLLRLGAQNLKNDDGETPREIARSLRHTTIDRALSAHGF